MSSEIAIRFNLTDISVEENLRMDIQTLVNTHLSAENEQIINDRPAIVR